jgi:hypothetical protein
MADSEKQIVRVLRAIEDGCEASPEVADATGLDIRWASALLGKLWRSGILTRETKRSFFRQNGRRPAYRYRLSAPRKPIP